MRAFVMLLAAFLTDAHARAADKAGAFDHYMLALSWSPSWCAEAPDRSDAAQCRKRMRFLAHGLWPQRADGWPEYCRTGHRDPTRRDTAAMADIMGSAGLAWHAWRKHGRCSDLEQADYFAALRRAFDAVAIPPALSALKQDVRIDPEVVEAAVIEANPSLSDAEVVTTCRGGAFREIRICLGRDLRPIACEARSSTDCAAPLVRLPAPE